MNLVISKNPYNKQGELITWHESERSGKNQLKDELVELGVDLHKNHGDYIVNSMLEGILNQVR